MNRKLQLILLCAAIVGCSVWFLKRTKYLELLGDFMTPIVFYGRVIDQHGNSVPSVDVILWANDKISGGSSSEYKRQTDSDGLFSISGVHGLTLAVDVSKPGYYALPPRDGKPSSSGLFEYGVAQVPFRSSKESPVIFVLYKQGKLEPLEKIPEKNFRMARDGTPLKISLIPQDGSERHQVVMRCWTKDLERPKGQRHYDWHFEINVSAGGLVKREDDFAFEAPENGYQPSDTINMSASMPYDQWDNGGSRSYFLKFNDGVFARVNIRMHAAGDHFVEWESYLNPKAGSRNLEAGTKRR